MRLICIFFVLVNAINSPAQSVDSSAHVNFPGGVSAMRQFISDNLKYTYSPDDSINGVNGKVVVRFLVDQDGKISGVEPTQTFNPKFDSASIKVITSMPRWEVKQGPKKFTVKFAIPFTFKLDKVEEKVSNFADNPPEFPGGQPAMELFIQKNIKYPKNAWKHGISGKVFIQFIINKDGSVVEVECIKGISSECDDEAKRVISMMPRWRPGSQKGKIVRVKNVIPVNFNGPSYRRQRAH